MRRSCSMRATCWRTRAAYSVALCAKVGVEFTDRMLAWPPGPRESDGVWAKHWYHSVHRSSGFQPYVPKAHLIPGHLESLALECEPHYRRLWERRLRA